MLSDSYDNVIKGVPTRIQDIYITYLILIVIL